MLAHAVKAGALALDLEKNVRLILASLSPAPPPPLDEGRVPDGDPVGGRPELRVTVLFGLHLRDQGEWRALDDEVRAEEENSTMLQQCLEKVQHGGQNTKYKIQEK